MKNQREIDKNNAASGEPERPSIKLNWNWPRYEGEELENGDRLLRVWMPDVPISGMSVLLDSDFLTIIGISTHVGKNGPSSECQERAFTAYRLSIRMTMKIETASTYARLQNGVLTIRLPSEANGTQEPILN